MCLIWFVGNESDDFLLGSEERLEVGFAVVIRAPDGDAGDEVRIDVGVVLFFHGGDWEEFVGISETVDGWL